MESWNWGGALDANSKKLTMWDSLKKEASYTQDEDWRVKIWRVQVQAWRITDLMTPKNIEVCNGWWILSQDGYC